jgi:KDO2-lipid IV(A) lauroyltransferase
VNAESLWIRGLVAARALARRLPPERRYRWAAALGRTLSRLFPGHRRAVAENLAVIGAFAGRRFSVDKVFENFGLMLADFLTDAAPEVPSSGREKAEALLRAGRGVLFLTSHLGHWEMGGRLLARWGWDVTAVYQPYRSRLLREFIQERRASGLGYLPVGKGAASGVGKILSRGGAVAVLADRPYGEAGEEVMLCGRPARLPRGPFLFAARHGAPVVQGAVLMEGPGAYRVVLEEPLEPSGKGPAAVKELLDRTARILEKYITLYAEQWFCFEPVWRAE